MNHALENDGIDRSKADAFIKKKDKARRDYQQFFTHTILGNKREYDLCLNSGRIGYEKCAELIIKAAEN